MALALPAVVAAADVVVALRPRASQTDEEQMWLEQQMMQAESQPKSAPDVSDGPRAPPEEEEEEPPTPSNTEAAPAAAANNDYDDVMKLIEENRRKNEAKRAAQSARNAEIIAAFEQRQRQEQ